MRAGFSLSTGWCHNTASLHVPSSLSVLLFGKALQTSTVSVREALFMVLQELNSAVNQ